MPAKTPVDPRERAAIGRSLVLAGLCLLLAGCVLPDPKKLLRNRAQLEEQTAPVMVPAGQAWADPPGRGIVLQRELRLDAEQRISLANRSLVEGDNVLILLARVTQPGLGRLRAEEFATRIGGWPAPFTEMSSGALTGGEDALGSYFWAEERFGADTICVLGLRRITSAMRQIPGDRDVMDVMLRNCTTGSVEDALRPLMADSLGITPAGGTATGGSRLLSPLAGPTAQ